MFLGVLSDITQTLADLLDVLGLRVTPGQFLAPLLEEYSQGDENTNARKGGHSDECVFIPKECRCRSRSHGGGRGPGALRIRARHEETCCEREVQRFHWGEPRLWSVKG